MKILYLPVFRAAIGYNVTLGQRWSLLEHMLLVALSAERRSLDELASLADLPRRLVIESLINLLRAGWIEVRSTTETSLFGATPIGKKRADDPELEPRLRRELRYASLCMDRATGSWLRTDDLELVYEDDLPEDAFTLEPLHFSLNYDDPGVRDLIYLNSSEGFDGFLPASKGPSRPFARIVVHYDEIRRGLNGNIPLHLKAYILEAASELPELEYEESEEYRGTQSVYSARETITDDSFIVGGTEHLAAIQIALSRAKTHVIIHSCFIHSEVIRKLLPGLVEAARRRVKVDLLWGLHSDPESEEKPRPIIETTAVLDELPSSLRVRVQLSPTSSGSHAKAIIYDDRQGGGWTAIIGSCNFLSSWYDSIDVSLRTNSSRLISEILSHLISAQLPASGAWPGVVRRLNRSWNEIKLLTRRSIETGPHVLTLASDSDHYACVTMARDVARKNIVVGCDLFGLAAETSVLVPLERAAELGRKPSLYYQRPSKLLAQTGRTPNPEELGTRGLNVATVDKLHGKFLTWDHDAAVVTSFNWLSTVVGNRSKGAELGVFVNGPDAATMLLAKLSRYGIVPR